MQVTSLPLFTCLPILTPLSTLHARSPAGQAPGLREAHDVAIARAVAELRVLAELCLPLVRPGGHWVAAKGAAPAEEVAAARNALGQLGGKLLSVDEVDSGERLQEDLCAFG